MNLEEYLCLIEKEKVVCVCDESFTKLFTFVNPDFNFINEYLTQKILNREVIDIVENCQSYLFPGDGVILVRTKESDKKELKKS